MNSLDTKQICLIMLKFTERRKRKNNNNNVNQADFSNPTVNKEKCGVSGWLNHGSCMELILHPWAMLAHTYME